MDCALIGLSYAKVRLSNCLFSVLIINDTITYPTPNLCLALYTRGAPFNLEDHTWRKLALLLFLVIGPESPLTPFTATRPIPHIH